MRRQGDPFDIPVFHYTELLGLAMGITPKELGLNMHRIKADTFLKDWSQRSSQMELIEEYFDLASLKRCHVCRACENDCPSALNVPKFEPQAIIGRVLEGKLEELLKLPEIWNCVECHTCVELCPQRFGMEKVFTILKRLAVEQNMAPETMKNMIDTFSATSRLGKPQATLSKRLKLPQAKPSGMQEWRELLERFKA